MVSFSLLMGRLAYASGKRLARLASPHRFVSNEQRTTQLVTLKKTRKLW
jgi:hypothetical protein